MGFLSAMGLQPGFLALAALMGGIWTFFKTHEWRERVRGKRYEEAVLALEAAVELTYRTYTESLREASQDGELTAEERARARALAREAAIEYGRRRGVDVAAELGKEYVDFWLEKLARKLDRTC